ncbi:MAG: membrane protein insertase YidC [Planctomycetes bacterium]|nr:membrane protein insertase YidC [Planctomycetota bacterium]
MQRFAITLLLVVIAVGITVAMAFRSGSTAPDASTAKPAVSTTDGAPPAPDKAGESAKPPGEGTQTPAAVPDDVKPISGLKVVDVTEKQDEPVIGSTEKDEQTNPYNLEAKFTPWGGGIKHVLLSRYSTSVQDHIPYPLQQQQVYSHDDATGATSYQYPMAAYAVVINGGDPVYVYGSRWQVDREKTTATTAVFHLTIADAADKPVLRLTRTWSLPVGRYDLDLHQTFENLTDGPLSVRFTQLGPVDLQTEGGYIGDRRKVVECYLQPSLSNPKSKHLTTNGHHLRRQNVVSQKTDTLWPDPKDAEDSGRDLAWVAMTNRYFAAAVHTTVDEKVEGILPLQSEFNTVRRMTWGGPKDTDKSMALLMDSVPMRIDAGKSAALELELFAGPMDSDLLKNDPLYVRLDLGDVIEFNLGGFCAFCTFAWLANGLLAFLQFLHWIVRDWGLAIMGLVAIVRTILHPLTKRSQVNMMKVSRQMASLKPELERLKVKYKDNPQKLNQETMALYREKNVNPAAMGLGCLPMLFQMPIWFALYAMLFFAIQLRHQPAFYDVFHSIGQWFGFNWQFLRDLSSQDNFITFPETHLGFVTISSINIIPILMSFVFFIQQKYTTQTTPAMNEQAEQQQKMMKFIAPLFPFLFYKMPCGLTLYILVSTSVGIIESKRVRAHIKEMEDRGDFDAGSMGKGGGNSPKSGGFWDRVMKAAEERQRQAQAAKGGGPGPRGGKRRK